MDVNADRLAWLMLSRHRYFVFTQRIAGIAEGRRANRRGIVRSDVGAALTHRD